MESSSGSQLFNLLTFETYSISPPPSWSA